MKISPKHDHFRTMKTEKHRTFVFLCLCMKVWKWIRGTDSSAWIFSFGFHFDEQHVERVRFLAIDLISHHLLQVNAGHRLAADSALRHVFFEVCLAWKSALISRRTSIWINRLFIRLGLSTVHWFTKTRRCTRQRTMVDVARRRWQMGTVRQRQRIYRSNFFR